MLQNFPSPLANKQSLNMTPQQHEDFGCSSDCRRYGCPDTAPTPEEIADNELYDPAKDPSLEKEEQEPIPF